MDVIRKKYLEDIRYYYDSNLIKVITGVRRCGKSKLLEQIKYELISNLNIKMDHIISINFEDVTFSKLTSYLKLNNYILKNIIDDNKYYVFLDEIQHIKQFEKTLASLKSTKNVSIFVTGSNSNLLSGRLGSLLVGRCVEFKIQPFSYREFIEYLQVNNLKVPNEPLMDYIKYGGMPQRLDYSNESQIIKYLNSVYEGIISKDICNSKSKINRENFTIVSKYILSNATKEFSAKNIVEYYNIHNNDKIYLETIYRYLEKMEEACLISRVKRYDIASKRNLKSIEKQYAIDSGFILASSNSNNISIAHLLENVIYNELIYRGYQVLIGKTYKSEIDFVVMQNGKKCFIQVTYMLADDTIIQREFGAYDSVRDPAPKFVLSLDKFDMSKNSITHINIIDWLEGKKELILL